MIKYIIPLVMVLVLSVATPTLAAEDGLIEGQLINGTEGGSSVADLDITLKTFVNNTEAEAQAITTKSDAEGRFIFDGLSTEPANSYQVTVSFQQADYEGKKLSFAEGETSKSIELTVYDSTTSSESIRVAMLHTVIFVEADTLLVEEYFIFDNQADLTYIGSREVTDGVMETLRFTLPDEATDLIIGQGLMDCCVYLSEDGFIDTMPVLPGVKEVFYSYRVNYSSDKYTLYQGVNYPIDVYEFLIQGGAIQVSSDQLTPNEPLIIEDTQFNRLSAAGLASGGRLTIQLSNLPRTDNQETILWVVLTLVVLGSGFGYLMRRRRLQQVSAEASLDQKRQGLLFEIAQLDDDLEDGKISAGDYRRQRAEKKGQLVKLTQQSKGEMAADNGGS